ncbi:MAG: hypothetical protein KDI44_07230 [Thiothrix sp.]|nr:hypothetical protein [Thiothrix sp.]HPQ96992.1 hypothetical protein [Thiolinea sp.]
MARKTLPTLMTETAVAAPQVVAHRLMRMTLAGFTPSTRDQKEFYRMGAEKVQAFQESWLAMGMQLMQANQQLMLSMLFPFAGSRRYAGRKGAERLATDVLTSGMKPVHKRAVANVRRLGRTR